MDDKLLEIQQRLKALGFDPGPLDGDWGPKTRDAIAAQLGIKNETPWLDLARSQLGLKEVPGAGNSAKIIEFYKEAGVPQESDAVPWCAAFVGSMLKRAGIKGTGSLMARSYLNWGNALQAPRLGCVAVFSRGAPPSGHVAFVESWDADHVRCLGGNQSNAVTEASFARSTVLGFRWPA